MAFREGTPAPRPNPKSPVPLPPAPAPLSPLATPPGCLGLCEHNSGSKAPLAHNCGISPSSCSQKHWSLRSRPSAPSSAPNPAWDGCQNPCVLPEALKKIERVASRCRRARRLAGKAWEGPSMVWFSISKQSQPSVSEGGSSQPGLGQFWLRAGWFVCQVFGLEEESTCNTVSTLSQPCAPGSAPTFLEGTGPGAIYAGVPGC